MQSAVVTGANGFLGGALVKELRRCGIRVLAVARSHDTLPDDPGIVRVKLDLSRMDQLPSVTQQPWDVFYHFAWGGIAGDSRKDVALHLFNAQATVQAVSAAKAMGCTAFIGAGSIMEKEILAASAQPGLRPYVGHIYSAAKLAAHLMSECEAARLDINHIWPMITNAYGEGEESPRFLNTAIRKLLKGEDLRLTPGEHYYDFIHVSDAAAAFCLLGQYGKPFREYVVGSGTARPQRQYVQELGELIAPQSKLDFGAFPYEGISLSQKAFDISALSQDTGFKPQVGFSRGIRQTSDWIQQTKK